MARGAVLLSHISGMAQRTAKPYPAVRTVDRHRFLERNVNDHQLRIDLDREKVLIVRHSLAASGSAVCDTAVIDGRDFMCSEGAEVRVACLYHEVLGETRLPQNPAKAKGRPS